MYQCDRCVRVYVLYTDLDLIWLIWIQLTEEKIDLAYIASSKMTLLRQLNQNSQTHTCSSRPFVFCLYALSRACAVFSICACHALERPLSDSISCLWLAVISKTLQRIKTKLWIWLLIWILGYNKNCNYKHCICIFSFLVMDIMSRLIPSRCSLRRKSWNELENLQRFVHTSYSSQKEISFRLIGFKNISYFRSAFSSVSANLLCRSSIWLNMSWFSFSIDSNDLSASVLSFSERESFSSVTRRSRST